ncbi:aldo/keto reductase [uncultured Limosilactobacillus sp.]|uniref:aldo/keto reductase n=1 Tax=uncultured Limosilactobacillus sp. TaxID=2837629 RepID=UPI0025F68DF9|nr:aldo/keto reductase [uncultured Limosilactobacillus sp.]
MQELTSLRSPLKLANGVEIPGLGYGTYKSSNEEVTQAVIDALAAGYRHIDTAAYYGNQKGIGEALRQTDLSREDIFITSKVWNTDRGYDQTMAAFEKTIAELGVDYLDLYLIHWPANRKQFGDQARKLNADTWRALENLYQAGRVRAIGVFNFMPNHLLELMADSRIKPMVDQIEYHPGWPQEATRRFCQRHGILVEAWRPLGTKVALENPLIQEIADKYQHSPAQVCLRWSIQQGLLPLPKSVNPERMKANADIFDFELTEDEMDVISSIRIVSAKNQIPDQVDF